MDSYLIAVDLDGTLLEPNGSILAEVLEHIARVRRAGHHLVLATGRRFSSTYALCGLDGEEPLLVPDWIMANERDLHAPSKNGVWLMDGEDLLEIERALLSQAETARRDMESICASHGLTFSSYQTPDVEHERGFLGLEFATEEDAQVVVPLLEDYLRERGIDLWPMRNRNAIVLRSSESAKGLTLKRLCQRNGFTQGRVLAIGDSHNDVDMLDGRHGFLSGCPANAETVVKEAVRSNTGHVSPFPNGRGVMDVIGRLIPGPG